jgi:hypothetical protein
MIPLHNFPQLFREGKSHITSATDQRSSFAERLSSATGPAEEPSSPGKQSSRPRLLQRLVRRQSTAAAWEWSRQYPSMPPRLAATVWPQS